MIDDILKEIKDMNANDSLSVDTEPEDLVSILEFKNFYKKYLNKQEVSILKDIESENRVDHFYEFGWYICNLIYKQIPCEFHMEDTFDIEVIDFLEKEGTIVHRKISENSSDSEYSDIVYTFLYKKMVIIFTYYCFNKNPDKCIKGIHIFHPIDVPVSIEELEQFKRAKKVTPKMGLIKQTKFGPQVSWRDYETENKYHEDNYNDDFPEFYKDLTDKLDKHKSGLYLFYGEAGTGKSSAIRHLISQVNRPFVFIPPQMINYLSNPEFTDLVISSLKNSILIIEDAEKALMKRETEDGFFNSELVSTLLNLTDGLYADIAATSIIATYNCDRNLIDPALLRKGRMKAEYKFNRLTVEKSQKLMDKLGNDVTIDVPMTLADIYNHEQQYTNEERKDTKKRMVGFGKGQ